MTVLMKPLRRERGHGSPRDSADLPVEGDATHRRRLRGVEYRGMATRYRRSPSHPIE